MSSMATLSCLRFISHYSHHLRGANRMHRSMRCGFIEVPLPPSGSQLLFVRTVPRTKSGVYTLLIRAVRRRCTLPPPPTNVTAKAALRQHRKLYQLYVARVPRARRKELLDIRGRWVPVVSTCGDPLHQQHRAASR